MDALNQSAFLKALGWSLLNSFWQFAVLWLLFITIIFLRKSISAGLKHAVALSFLIIGFAWFAAGLSYRYFAYSEIAGFEASPFLLSDTGYTSALYRSVTAFLDNNLSYVSVVYLFVVAALFIKFFGYFYYTHKIQTRGLTKMKAELRLFVEQLSAQLDIRRKVKVWLSEYVDTPIIVGFLQPTILIPFACMNQLTTRQLEAIILHELAHIKRNDYLLNLFIAITEIVFFFNPFSRLFAKTIQQERENSCDDQVLQFQFGRHEYASALLSLEKNRGEYLRLTLAATGANTHKTLLTRVKRIMEVKVSDSIRGGKLFAYFLSVALLTFVAFFNPGDVVIRNLAKEFSIAKPVLIPSVENEHTIVSEVPAASHEEVKAIDIDSESALAITEAVTGETAVIEHEAHEDGREMLMINVADLAYEGFNNTSKLIAAVQEEHRDFSKTDNLLPIVPEGNAVTVFPFVPSSSFSYVIVDTSKPKLKAENYYERNARESLVKAKKAVQQIDWEKIERQLDSKVDMKVLRKEIEKSLEAINWQLVNEEVKIALSKEDADRMNALRQEAEELNRFRVEQMRLQQLQSEIDLQREIYKKNIDKQQLQIQEHLQQQRKKPGKIIVCI